MQIADYISFTTSTDTSTYELPIPPHLCFSTLPHLVLPTDLSTMRDLTTTPNSTYIHTYVVHRYIELVDHVYTHRNRHMSSASGMEFSGNQLLVQVHPDENNLSDAQ